MTSHKLSKALLEGCRISKRPYYYRGRHTCTFKWWEKDHIYIWENNENMLHENDALKILHDMCANEHIRSHRKSKKEKLNWIAECDGLFKG